MLQAAVQQFYEDRVPPPEIHLPLDLGEADTTVLEEWLSSRAERRVRLVVPKRGEKRGLLELAARNAELAYQQRFNENTAANYDALETLRAVLALPAVPRRIECFDISTIQGSETVASMVVCEDGRMRKGEYRKFRIRGASALGARRSVPGAPELQGRRETASPGTSERRATPSRRAPESTTTLPPCTRSCSGAIAACSRRVGRSPI